LAPFGAKSYAIAWFTAFTFICRIAIMKAGRAQTDARPKGPRRKNMHKYAIVIVERALRSSLKTARLGKIKARLSCDVFTIFARGLYPSPSNGNLLPPARQVVSILSLDCHKKDGPAFFPALRQKPRTMGPFQESMEMIE
jgi:hypothetical protein